jgi:hypothetical protein
MLLRNKELRKVLIPVSSKCFIVDRGIIKDGDVISVTSPIFSSINYSSKAIMLDESFKAVFRTNNPNGIEITDDNNEAYLNSEDQDVNSLYVTMTIGK